jgi:putrescine transport system substrate-binding protein
LRSAEAHPARWAAWLAAAAAILAAPLPGCSGQASESTAGDRVLNVYNWSDYINPEVITQFEKEYGIHVNYDVFDTNEILETKLLTGFINYDIVVPSGAFLERQIEAGVFRKIDKARVPNLKYMDPRVEQGSAQYDPGNQYGIDYMWITSGPGYNVAQVRRRMPDAPVDSWRMFYDPAVISRFRDCGVAMIDAPSEVVATALIFLGRNPESSSEADLAAAERVLLAIRPYIRYVSSAYIDDLANGEICLALGWSGDVKQASDRAREAGRGIEVRYAIPREGAVENFDMLAVPVGAPHPRNAFLFINFLLRPAVAAKNSDMIKYANGVEASIPLLDPSVRADPGIYPPPAVRARLHPEPARSIQYTRLLNRMWTRFKTGE